jgi:NADH-quinone oxidoreductase subunit B
MRISLTHLALACCGVEVATAVNLTKTQDLLTFCEPNESPDAHVLLIAGTVTKAIESDLKSTFDALPSPKYAIAYGVCASTGGPYWDSYAVAEGADKTIAIDRYVPGCPPPAETLVDAILTTVGGK